MPEEIKTQNEQKNTVATVGMWFSIIGLVLFISVFLVLVWNVLLTLFGIMGFLLCFPLLLIWFILWIIGLFYKPRGKARVAVILPLIAFIALLSYAWKSVETPVNEFIGWVEPQFEQFENDENFDSDRFGDLLEVEFNKIANDITEDEWKVLFESSVGSNSLEKAAYALSSMAREWFENALEKYNNGELPEFDEENVNNIIDVDIDVEDENDIEDESDVENDSEDEDDVDNENKPIQQDEVTVTQPKKSNNGTFTQSEKNDIEQILDILE